MSLLRHFSRLSVNAGRVAFPLKQKLQDFKSALKLPEKYKGGRLEKISLYWKSLGEDYKVAVTDIITDMKKRPLKATIVMSGVALLGYAVKTNPKEHSFLDEVAAASNDLLLLSDDIRNTRSDSHVRHLEWCINKRLLRTLNLIVATVVWEADYDAECDTYAAHCTYLQPRYVTFYERVLDVGVMGRWLNLALKMKDYDINEAEWAEVA